jgi:uncharacterized delta-60 repeat protein
MNRLHAWRLFSRVVAASALIAMSASFAGPGDADQGFGTGQNGVVKSRVGTLESIGWSSAEQHDGKIVTVGYCFENATLHHFCIARFRTDGTPDIGFGGATTNHFFTKIGSAKSAAFAVAIQRDGKIVVGGECQVLSGNDLNFCLARYLTNGQLDTSFGTGGTVVYSITLQQDTLRSLAIQTDGKIVAAGGCGDLGNAQFCIARFLSTGAIDLTFGTQGYTRSPVLGAALGFDLANAMAMQADGKFIMAGACFTPAGEYDFCSLRFHSNGTLDHLWGNQGSVVTNLSLGKEDSATDVVAQPDGKVILVGSCRNADNSRTEFCAIRYNPDNTAHGGLADTTYGNNSIVRAFNPELPGIDHIAYGAALQQDGKLVIAGSAGGGYHVSVRVHSDGARHDQFWGVARNGWTSNRVNEGYSNVRDMLLQRDGKVLMSGTCGGGGAVGGPLVFCLLRLEGGPQNYKRCSADIDGDGIVTAHIDTLIVMRRMQGVIGPAVIAGINFPPNAKRRTWGDGSATDVRRFLREECGMPLPSELTSPTDL